MKHKIISLILVTTLLISVCFSGSVAALPYEGKPLAGDINGDGRVNVSDCVCLKKIVAAGGTYNKDADIDRDGKITKNDTKTLAEYITGISTTPLSPVMKGIDVSDHNGIIDWQAVKDSGIEFAVIRLGFGDDETEQDDIYFERNVSECERLGIPWGTYIYSYALCEREAESEVRHCLRRLEGKKPTFPVFFDMEDGDGYKARHGGLSSEMAVKICNIFLSSLESRGYYVSLYASIPWFNGLLNDRSLERYDKWVAQWNETNEFTGSFGVWQYGGGVNYIEEPYVPGIDGTVDKDYAYKDYPTIIKEGKLNGWS